ncbi:hypothetical protein [Erwinia amylovora]|uniref:hypothetical protein n=1 Tax=Erwinia amylovora TaxID=552 RepID=UPI0014444534|nr:hypothetical protein [Erwinia amylovora]
MPFSRAMAARGQALAREDRSSLPGVNMTIGKQEPFRYPARQFYHREKLCSGL